MAQVALSIRSLDGFVGSRVWTCAAAVCKCMLSIAWIAHRLVLDAVGGNVNAVGAIDPEGRDALQLANLLQVAGVAAVEAAHHEHHVQLRLWLRIQGGCNRVGCMATTLRIGRTR